MVNIFLDGYTNLDGYIDGYNYAIGPRSYYEHQLNIKLTEEDMKQILEINKVFFENEASNSMLGRILIRKGIAFYQKINNNLT